MTNDELKKIREEKNQSKGEFAKILGITPMVYGRYESGTLKIPENIEAAVKEMLSKAADAAVATEIEVKKNARSTIRKAKEAVEAVVTSDEAVATEIEVKKKTRSAARKAKEAVKSVPQKKKTAVLIQSQLGGMITPEEVLKRIPEGCDQVYIKPEENKAYWVKGDESGAVELW